MEEEKFEFTDEEKTVIEIRRVQNENMKKCSEEINAILEKYGFTLQVIQNPKITLIPVNRDAI